MKGLTPEGVSYRMAGMIREYEVGDLEELKRIHSAQGFGYAFPDLSDPLFVTKLVLERGADGDGNGKGIAAAALLRLTAEAYLLIDPESSSPREKWRTLVALHEAAAQDAWRRGLSDAHAWLPPEIAAKFGRRLTRLGWVRDDAWTPYCRRLT